MTMWYPEIPQNKAGLNSLVKAIENAIKNKTLNIGDRLPPQRILAWRLGINPTTVSRAYKKAAEKGLVGGQVGRGTYVLGNNNAALYAFAIRDPAKNAFDLSVNRLHCCSTLLKINQNINDKVRQIVGSANAREPYEYITNALNYRYQMAICHYLKQFRHISYQPQQVLAMPSSQYAIYFLLSKLCSRGEGILVDTYTAPSVLSAAKALNLRLIPVHCDEEGILPQAFESAIKQYKAGVTIMIPGHQSPMATTQGIKRRQALAGIIARYNLILIEDDIYGSYRTPPPISTMLDENAFLISGFSKSLSGGHRITYIASRDSRLKQLSEHVHETVWLISVESFYHVIVAIEENYIEQSIAHINTLTEKKNQLLRNVIPQLSGGNTVDNIIRLNAPHQWLKVRQSFLQRLEKKHVFFAGADLFRQHESESHPYVRLSVIGTPMHRFEAVVQLLRGELE